MAKHILISSVLGAGALFFGACVEAPDTTSEPGSLRMGVVGEDDEGNIYRLRDGVFDISGPEVVSVSTETNPMSQETLNVELAAGNYDILLNDGWRLERWDPITDSTLDVMATLTSVNPASALVTGTETSSVVFTFLVPDAGPVTLGDGDLEIDIDVDIENPIPELTVCDPLAPACGVDESCYPIQLAPEDPLTFGCGPVAGTAALYDDCEFVNGCAAGLFCLDPVLNANCLAGGIGCCLPFCDVSAPGCDGGEVCSSFNTEDPNVGFCATP